VGNDGETLVADSSTSTGLKWQSTYVAGRNFLINGAMDIWQRSTSAASTGGSYNAADRWWCYHNSGTATISRESTIVPAGSQYAMKIAATSAGTSIYYGQVIETANAVGLAGQTITVSAKVAASTSVALAFVIQYNTSVDSTASWTTVTATSGGTATPTSTTYVSMSGVYAMPSTAKTIRIGFQQTGTVASGVDTYIGQIQTEIGSVATAFSRNAATIQGELSACQRYYQRFTGTAYGTYALAYATSTTNAYVVMPFQTQMRTAPTVLDYASLAIDLSGTSASAVSVLAGSQSSSAAYGMNATTTGLTAFRTYDLCNNNTTSGYIGFGAEL
jgi:hypothetical protein